MFKKAVMLLVISLFVLVGCRSYPTSIQGDCLSNADCDDGFVNTINRCEGTPTRCIEILKTCNDIYGFVCAEGRMCDKEFETEDELHCCVGMCLEVRNCDNINCPDNKKCIEGECILKNCDEMKGYICESAKNCPGDFSITEDSSSCCEVECIPGNVRNFIIEEITGYNPEGAYESSPDFAFTDEFDEGGSMIYEKDNENVVVEIWEFNSVIHINQDLNNYMHGFGDADQEFMEDIYEEYDVIGIKEIGSEDKIYIWQSYKRVIKISETDDVFLKKYLDKYRSDFNTTYFE